MAKTKRMTLIRAGRLVRAVIYTQAMPGDTPAQRAAKTRVSSEARIRLNRRASWEKCEEVLAANFDADDLWITFTYRDADLPPTREAAVRCLNRFLSMLRQARAARGESVLYVKNVEHLTDSGEPGRWHHHVVLNSTGADYEEIRALWSAWGDNVDFESLLGNGQDYESRARYLCKERQPPGKQTWTPSRGLLRPQRTSELVDDALTLNVPADAVLIDRDAKENAWGSFLFVKYLLPRRPQPPDRSRRRESSRARPFSDLG